MKMTDINDWLGRRDPAELDPERMQYQARLAAEDARDCAGCVFKGQHSKVCKAASAAAVRAGMNDCDDIDSATRRSFIYVLVAMDPRQQTLVEG